MPFKLSPSKICLFLTLLLGILIFYPRSNFQVRLAQGDHGRDLYSFQQTAQGAIPIHDYWTQNGPLMPYYYALIYKIFGSTIQSTLLGYYFLVLCAGLMIFLIAREFLSPLAALAGVLWYWTFRGEEFFYTYNHIGAVVCVLLSIYCLVRHIKNNTIRPLILGFLCLFILFMIRPSIATGSLAAYIISCIAARYIQKRPPSLKAYGLLGALSGGIILISTGIYKLCSYGIPQTTSAQKDTAFWVYAKWNKILESLVLIKSILLSMITQDIPGIAIGVIIGTALIGTLFLLFVPQSNISLVQRRCWRAVFLSLTLFIICNLGEFFLSGVWFRSFWSMTPFFLLLFFLIDFGMNIVRPAIKNILLGILVLFCLTISYWQYQTIRDFKVPANLFHIGKHKIYLSDSEQEWIKTITETVDYLQSNLSSEEDILALPYTPLYYFLLEKTSPTRDLIFIKQDPSREAFNLGQITKKNVRYILLSNRALRPMESRLGIFGQTYGVKINSYLEENFEPVATFGPFESPAGWTDNHAVRIYHRKTHIDP